MATITDGTSNTIAAGESLPAQRADNNVWQYSANIPAGYGDVRTTTLTAEVKEQSNSIDFKLSDAEAPPEPKASQRRGRKGRWSSPGSVSRAETSLVSGLESAVTSSYAGFNRHTTSGCVLAKPGLCLRCSNSWVCAVGIAGAERIEALDIRVDIHGPGTRGAMRPHKSS